LVAATIRTSTFRVTVQALDLALLEHAQELGLKRGLQVADLVEKEGPAVGELEAPGLRLGRASEGALFVAEQLALDQRGRECGAVDGDQRRVTTRAPRVERPGEELLAAAGLAEE
jgi:hypothetical protein